MGPHILADLEHAQQCTASDMIKFLLAFCWSGDEQVVPVHDEQALGRVFEEAKDLAKPEGTTLRTSLSEL
jgi:hypothetical protein